MIDQSAEYLRQREIERRQALNTSGPDALAARVERLERIGGQLANAAFNVSQHQIVSDRDKATLFRLSLEGDATLAVA